MHTDKNNDEQFEQIKQAVEDEARVTNVGFQNPNSPLDLAGLDPLPESGGVGALDPEAGGDIEGEDQAHDREINSADVHRSGRSRQITPKSEDRDEQSSGGGSSSW